ncbi:hypothetical protein ABFT51_16835 [Paenibacillus peoriae]
MNRIEVSEKKTLVGLLFLDLHAPVYKEYDEEGNILSFFGA